MYRTRFTISSTTMTLTIADDGGGDGGVGSASSMYQPPFTWGLAFEIADCWNVHRSVYRLAGYRVWAPWSAARVSTACALHTHTHTCISYTYTAHTCSTMLKRKLLYANVYAYGKRYREREREREGAHTYATPLWELALWITRARQEYYGGRVFISAQKDDVYVYVHEWEGKRETERIKRVESRTMKRKQGAVHSSACAILIPISVSIRCPDTCIFENIARLIHVQKIQEFAIIKSKSFS